MSRHDENDILVLFDKLVPHIVAVVSVGRGLSRNDGSAPVISRGTYVICVHGRSVAEQIRVRCYDYVTVGISLDYIACPCKNIVGSSVVERKHQIFDLAYVKKLVGVSHSIVVRTCDNVLVRIVRYVVGVVLGFIVISAHERVGNDAVKSRYVGHSELPFIIKVFRLTTGIPGEGFGDISKSKHELNILA